MKQIPQPIKRGLYSMIADKKRWLALLSMLMIFTLLIVTFSWYKNQVTLEGSTFETGTLDFVATGYDQDGTHVTTILPDDADPSAHEKVNQPLFNKNNWQAGITETAFLVVEKTGTLPMDFKIGFTAAGQVEYLGGFWYALTDVTNDVANTTGNDEAKLQGYVAGGYVKQTEDNGYNMATMDRYATMGSLDDATVKRYYRLDYGMKDSAITEEYTNKAIEVFLHIYVTQPGAFEADASTGYTYNCANVKDIENAIEQALPGDSIRLLNNITYEGDLVINKAINLITNNFTLNVLGNLIYNYVAPTELTINVTGNGQIKVASPSEDVGGNMTITAPNSEVRILGGNKAGGDIVIDGNFTVQATHAYGLAGATLSTVKMIDGTSSAMIPVYVESDTRITVANNTTVYKIEAVENASNIEIQNAGTIQNIVLTNMNTVAQTNAPQIYIVNASNITNTIQLPVWSVKFVTRNTTPISYSGNTRIVQTITGNTMTVAGATAYTNSHIEKESTDVTVAPLGDGHGRLVVYYQNTTSQRNATVQSLLTEYFEELGMEPTSAIAAVTELRIISVGEKQVNNTDIAFIRGSQMASLTSLDLERAGVYDNGTNTPNRLATNAFSGITKLTNLVLPQNLEQLGTYSLGSMNTNLLVTIPASVTTFDDEWYYKGRYVAFASPTPVSGATQGMDSVQAVFVEEAYVDAYQTAYSSLAKRIYPMAQLDDTTTHFVRQLAGTNLWEIVCYVGTGSGDLQIGNNIRVGGQPITVVGVGENSYRNSLTGAEPIITFADTVEYIGENAFRETTVTKINGWGTHMKTIHPWAFAYASRLSDVAPMPASMETINDCAFNNCTALLTLNTGGTTYLGTRAFEKCSAMTHVELPKVETIGDGVVDNYVFYQCSKLVSVSAPSLYQVNKGYTFAYCKALREIILGSDKAVTLGSGNVFYQTSSGQIKVFVPEPLVEDYRTYNTLGGINNLKIYPVGDKMGDNSATYGYNIGDYIVSDKLNGDGTVTLITSNLSYSGDVTLPSEWNGKPITSIYENAFRNQTFTNVTLNVGSNMETIGKNAFNSLNGIVGDLTLPNSMVEIQDGAFNSCKGITSINTGGTVTLGSSVFTSCSKIVTAQLPNVVTVGNNSDNAATFSSCTALVSVSAPKLTIVYKNNFLSSCQNLRELYLGSTDDAFTLGTTPFNSITTANQKLIKIYVPASALDFYLEKKPGGSSFETRIYAQGTKYGENLVNGHNIGEYIYTVNDDNTATLITSTLSFSGDVTLPDSFDGHSVSTIGRHAFTNQTFTNVSLTVGNSVKTLDGYAFSSVTGLTSIDLRNVVTLNGYCFNGATGLTNVIANKLVTMTGSYNFGNCTKLTAINLPELVTMEGGRNFNSCSALVTARLPKLVTMAGGYNFYSCSKLQSVYFEQIASFTNNDLNVSGLKEIIINKVINTTADLPVVSGNLSYGSIMVPAAYQSFYTTKWKNRPVVTMDKTFEDDEGNQFFIIPNGSDCAISYYMGNAPVVTIPDTITIGADTYTVVEIRRDAFTSATTSLQSITLPVGLHTFDSNALLEVETLQAIHVAEGNRSFVDKNGVLYTKDGTMLLRYPKAKADAAYTVDNATAAIGAHAFNGAANLTAITFGSGLTAIDSTAFVGCTPATVTFTGNLPPVLMSTGMFDSTVTNFTIVVPEGRVDSYIRGVNFTPYAAYINGGTTIPTSGDMNQTPWSSGGVQTAALPPQAAEIPLGKKEDEDDEPLAL